MNSVHSFERGIFLFTLDTELAWGHFDCFDPAMFSAGGKRERQAIMRLLDMFDEYQISATWAVVGHLFYAKCEQCEVCPVRDWQGKFESYHHVYEVSSPLWYAADIMQTLVERRANHEIAFHGYTHRIFDEQSMSAAEARFEIDEWVRVVQRMNVPRPGAVVFPRNKVGHVQEFGERGFLCYRGDELLPADYYQFPVFGKLINRLDLLFQFRVPQVYLPQAAAQGLLNLPASRGLFRVRPAAQRLLNCFGLGNLPLDRLLMGVEKAAREKKILHVYAHPYEFRTQKEFDKLRAVLDLVSQKVRSGSMASATMTGLAGSFLQVTR